MIVIIAMIVSMIASFAAVLPTDFEPKDRTVSMISISPPTVNLSLDTPCSGAGNETGWEGYFYLRVDYSVLGSPLYFRLRGLTNVPGFTYQSVGNSSCTTEISGHRWYLNATDGNLKLYYDFTYGSIDAAGDQTYVIYGNVSLATDDATHNATELIMYVGENSIFDTLWMDNTLGNAAIREYYGLFYPESVKNLLLKNSGWFMSISNQAWYWAGPPHGYSSLTTTGGFEQTWTYPPGNPYYNGSEPDLCPGVFRMTFKIVMPDAQPISGPAILDLMPFSDTMQNDDEYQWRIVSVFDNETMIREAAQVYGYEYVVIHSRYFSYDAGYQELANYWKPTNASIAVSLNNIRNYTHKYGMEFGLYFGWMHGTKWGSLTSYNSTSPLAAIESWQAFKAYWEDKVDFYFFDAAILDQTWGQKNWTWNNLNLLDPIFKDIKYNQSKKVFMNAFQGQIWWADNQYLFPLRYEGTTMANIETIYSQCVDGDPWAHGLNRAWAAWYSPFFEGTYGGNDWNLTNYNVNKYAFVKKAYEWGFSIFGAYYMGEVHGWYIHSSWLAQWRGSMVRQSSVIGVSGSSAIFESNGNIRVFLENGLGVLHLVPAINPILSVGQSLYVAGSCINFSITQIEFDIDYPRGIQVFDMTTGIGVDWHSGSIVWSPQNGHLYRIYAPEDSSTDQIKNLIPWAIGLVILSVVIGFAIMAYHEGFDFTEIIEVMAFLIIGLSLYVIISRFFG